MVHSTRPPILNEFETETESVFEKKQRRKKMLTRFRVFFSNAIGEKARNINIGPMALYELITI